MELTLPQDCNYELSEHFAQRWQERTPDDWDRFVWVLTRGAHHIMCVDLSRKTHLLHYNPRSNCWYVFFYTRNARTGKMILVSILPEQFYTSVSNSAPTHRHKDDAIALLKRRSILPSDSRRSGIRLSYRISSGFSNKVVEFPLKWSDVSGVNDLYPFYKNFNRAVDELIVTDEFSDAVCRKHPVGVKIYATWITVMGTSVVVDVTLNDEDEVK